ncbi:hypothetical protein LTR94_025774, partial [Friedmanniomyces endolithicus]
LFAPFGSDRGAMRVWALGVNAQGQAAQAVWLLVAEPGAGPVTPGLAALAAVKAIAAKTLAPGARPFGPDDLDLASIQAEIDRHPISVTRTEDRSALFWRALGDDFDQLPEALRALHETSGLSVWRGQARVDGPANWVAGLVGRLIGFPARGGEAPVEVMIDAGATRSIWRRRIGQARFASRLSSPEPGGQIRERFGFLTMKLQLQVQGERLAYLMQGWSLGVLPLPKALAPRTETHEAVDGEGRFTFDVDISMPIVGCLVRYRGWLTRQ